VVPEDWNKAKTLIAEALQRPADERARFLSEFCTDASLRAEIETLLQHATDAELLESSTIDRLLTVDAQSLSSGTRLGRYEVISLIGAGGMGQVYRARDTRLGRDVAVKVLRPDFSTDPDRLYRFEQEARASARLEHPHIVAVYDIGVESGISYIVSELLDGKSLRSCLRDGPLETRRAVQYAIQIADGLAAAHSRGIVHRDLKPDNVFITTDGRAKILDFGIAKLIEPLTATTTWATVGTPIIGTAGYMSPEQVRGDAIDHRSDIFSFGAVLFEMLTGQRAFDGATGPEMMAAVLRDEPRDISNFADAPPALEAIVRHCLEKLPAQRFQSARDVRFALESLTWAPDPAKGVPPAPVAEPVATHSAPGRYVWLRSRLGPRLTRGQWLGVLATTTAIAVAVVTWLSMRPSRAPDPTPPLVAVREFRSLSADQDQTYFAAGMTEEIRGQLSKMSGLRIVSRAAVEKYAQSGVQDMIRDLGVRTVVEGSVRRERDRVRITVELTDARNQQTLWSERYDRGLTDVFSVQSDVALQIANALKASLSPDERARVEMRPTSNVQAYELYLRARNAKTGAETQQLLNEALALDPRFATAKAALAYMTLMRGYSDPIYFDEAIRLAQETLTIDPASARAHGTIAAAFSVKGEDAQARLSYLRALELNPSDTLTMNNLSIHEVQFGRLDESLYWARRAFALSAKTGTDYYHVAVPLATLRDEEVTAQWLGYAEQAASDVGRVQHMLAILEFLQGRGSVALARLRTALTKQPKNFELLFDQADMAWLTSAPDLEQLTGELFKTAPASFGFGVVPESVRTRWAYLLQRRGDLEEARAVLDEAEKAAVDATKSGSGAPALIDLAAVNVLQNNRKGALDILNRAFTNGARDYAFLEPDPLFAPLRSDPAFRSLIERMKSDVTVQRDRARQRGLFDLQPLLPSSK
jgi:eukaryotic-like serine/threonine-protein kinase